MKKSKYTEEQIAFALRLAETGTRVVEVCRKMGIAEQTFYSWKRKYGGLGGCGSVRSQQRVFGTAIKGFMSCFDVRAGTSITSGCTGSTGKKGLICAGGDLVVMSWPAGGWTGPNQSILMLAGAWILSATACLTGAGSGP